MKRNQGFTLIELLIVVAIIAILASIAVPNFLEAQTRAKVSRTQADMHTVMVGIESYFVDHNEYPSAMNSCNDTDLHNHHLTSANYADLNLPSFRTPVYCERHSVSEQFEQITSPIAYLSALPRDLFATTRTRTFAYSLAAPFPSRLAAKGGWIMWSFGPDADEREPIVALPSATVWGILAFEPDESPVSWSTWNTGGDTLTIYADAHTESAAGGDCGYSCGGHSHLILVHPTMYSLVATIPSPALLDVTYDPTNGSVSNGDIHRWKN